MARRIRDLSTSEWFHVFNRGADRQDVFSGDGDYLLFEQLLDESVDRFALQLHAYALMSNHFHLLVHAPEGQLSEAMQRICGRFGAAYNRRTRREGPVFTNRFKSVADTGGSAMPEFTCDDIENAVFVGRASDRWAALTPVPGQMNELRMLVIMLAVELRAAPVTDLADRYGVDPQSIRRTARRGRVAVATESDFARRRESVLGMLRRANAA
jgi:REP element-mobilizing transposase RayT